MSIDMARLGFVIDTSPLTKLDRELDKVDKRSRRVGGAAADMEKRWASSMDRMRAIAVRAGAAIGSALGAFQGIRMADQYTGMTNSLKTLGYEGDKAAAKLRDIAKVAQETRAPLEQMVQMYQRVSIAGTELGATQDQILRFSKNVGLALAQQGGSAEAARGALLQMSQAIAGGVVRAEEFNSMLEGGYRILLAAAKGIDETGGSVAKLRKMMLDGRLTSKMFFDAVLSQSADLEKTFGKTSATVSQAMGILKDSLIMAIGEIDAATGATSGLAQGIISISQGISTASTFIIENLDRIAGYAIAVAVALTARMIPAFAASATGMVVWAASALRARLATLTLSAALGVLRTAIMRTGFGIIVIAIAEVITLIFQARDALGSWGQAFKFLGDLARLTFNAIVESAKVLPSGLQVTWARIAFGFADLVEQLHQMWASFLANVADGLSSIGATEMSDKFNEMGANTIRNGIDQWKAAETALGEAEANRDAAVGNAKAAWAEVAKKYGEIGAAAKAAADSTNTATTATNSLGTALAGTGGGKGGKGAAEKLSEAAKKIRDLKLELERLTQTYGMTELAATIFAAQQEAGVSATSKQGQEIASLITQIDALKIKHDELAKARENAENATTNMASTMTGVFRAALSGSDKLKSALASLAGQASELLLNRAFMMLLGGGKGGSGGGGWFSQLISKFLPSFDGGGYTGSGQRVGGLDGKGGTLAMVHPQERIIDETKSNGGSGSVDVKVGVDVDRSGNLVPFVSSIVKAHIKAADKSIAPRVRGVMMDPKVR